MEISQNVKDITINTGFSYIGSYILNNYGIDQIFSPKNICKLTEYVLNIFKEQDVMNFCKNSTLNSTPATPLVVSAFVGVIFILKEVNPRLFYTTLAIISPFPYFFYPHKPEIILKLCVLSLHISSTILMGKCFKAYASIPNPP